MGSVSGRYLSLALPALLCLPAALLRAQTQDPAPQPPVNLSALFSAAAKKVELAWAPAPAGTPAAAFNIYRAQEPHPGSFMLLASGLTVAAYSDPLWQSATYYYRVTALNQAGLESEPSSTAAVLADVQAPGFIDDLRVSSVSAAAFSVELVWTVPWEDVELDRYIIKGMESNWGDSQWSEAQTLAEVAASTGPEGSAEKFTLVLPSTDTVMFLAVKAVDKAGNVSDYRSGIAVADFYPPALTLASPVPAEGVAGRPFTVSYTAQDNYALSRVELLVDGAVIDYALPQSGSFGGSRVWDITAYQDGAHAFSIRAEDYSGNAARRDLPVTVNYAPPPVPRLTSPQSPVSLAAPSVYVCGTAETGIYVSLFAGDELAASVQSWGEFCSNITLPGDGTFEITAQAADRRGVSPRSAPLTAVVDSGPPGAPLALSAGSAAGGKVALLWSPPEGEVPVSYNLYRSASETALTAGQAPPPALRSASGVAGAAYTDAPPADGVYYYAAASVDAAGNESVLSNVSAALADGAAPSAAVAVSSAPPLGAGAYEISAEISEPLASRPYLTFTPYGQAPVQISLAPATALVWRGTLTVTAAMASGAGEFAFGGTDLSGNTGGPVVSGRFLELDTKGPSAALALSPARPALRAGVYTVELALDKPARSAPLLSYGSSAGPVAVALVQGADASRWSGELAVGAATGEGPHYFFYSARDALGNEGALLSGTTYFVVDTASPGAPLSLNGAAGAGGAVELSWSAPSGEKPSSYCVYRDGQQLSCAAAPAPGDFTGRYSDMPAEGPRVYAVSALDAAGNEGPQSAELNITADGTPPEPPVVTSWSVQNGAVELAWAPGGAETPAKYRLYRATAPFGAAQGLPYRVVLGGGAADTPEADGEYYYALGALDAAGNESALSPAAGPVPYDGSAPRILVSGVADGGHYGAARPEVEILDLNLAAAEVALNGLPFVPGSPVTAEGVYTLAVSAQDLGGRSSQKSVSFVIDRTSPSVALAGVADGGYYEQPVSPVITVSDPHLAGSTATLDGAVFAPGASVSAAGQHLLAVSARDKAGNTASLSAAFTLNPPPAAPAGLTVAIEDGKAAALAWQTPAAPPALYKVYKDGVYLGPAAASSPWFRDAAYSASGARVYEVAAIDAKGREGARARAEVPPLLLELAGYGTYLDGAEALNRGFFDLLRFRLINNGAAPVAAGQLLVELAGAAAGEGPGVEVPAGGSAETAAAIYASTGLPAAVSGRAALALPGGVSLSRAFTLNARDPRQPVVEVFPEALVKGNYANVRLKLNNRGSAPLHVVTARLGGGAAAPSKAVAAELRTPAGLALARAELAQTAGAAIALAGGEQLYFITVPGGGSYTFAPLRPAVPPEADEELTVAGLIGGPSGAASGAAGLAWSLPYGAVYSPARFTASRTAVVVPAAPYAVSLAADKAAYDRVSTVTLSGYYSDTWGNPLAGQPLLLTVSNKGFERKLEAVSGADGGYSAGFVPAPGEAGVYEVSARHPDFAGEAAHSSFSVVGMEFNWTEYALTMARNSSHVVEAELANTGETPLEGLAASVRQVSGTGVAAVPAAMPAVIAAGTRHKLNITLSASGSASENVELVLRVTDANGFARELPLHVKTVAAQVIAKLTPSVLELGLLAGETRTQRVTVENIGFSTWTDVRMSAPALGWARVEGLQSALGDIPPGGNASFTLVFEPPAGLPNGSYPENPLVTVGGGGAAAALNAGITVTSSRKGVLLFNVASADIPAENPTGRLGGAEVRLTSLDIAGLALSAAADGNGLARFEEVPAGKYAYKAEARGYNPVSGSITAEPGLEHTQNLYLPTTMVTYKWSVTPTTVLDKYDITLAMTFRTDVPAPAIVLDPPSLALKMKGGETAYAQVAIKNKGLVSAFDLKTELNGDGVLRIETPVKNIPELKAGQTVVVPLKITLDHASVHQGCACFNGYYEGVCARAPAGACACVSGGDVGTAAGGGSGWTGGGGGGFGFSGGQEYVPVVVSAPAVAKQCGDSGDSSSRFLAQGSGCTGADPLTGSNREPFPVPEVAPGSPAPAYAPWYDSVSGWSDGNYTLEPQADGGVVLTLPDGTEILFMPTGALTPELTGNLPQFDQPAAFHSKLMYIGGQYTLTDKDGTVTRFESVPIAGIGCDGASCARPRVYSRTDRNGGALVYTYTRADTEGKLRRITDPHGRYIEVTYTAEGKPATVADFTGRQVSYEYDAAGNLTRATDLDGARTVYAYDGQNRMTAVEYPNGARKTITYDGENRALTISEDNGNNAQAFEYLAASSRTLVTNALGRVTAYDYITVDGRKEVTKITAPDGTVTRYGYDERLNRVSVTDALNRATTMEYDGNGNLLAARDPAGNTTRLAYESRYNQPVSVTDARGNMTAMRYDLRGNLMALTDALGNVTEMSYDALGHVTGTKDPLGQVSLFEYATYGALTKVTDPLNRVTELARDNLSRVTRTKDPKNKLTLFEYDIKGNLTKVTDAIGGITEYNYTGGCPSCGGGDLLASVKDAKNQTTSFQYDLQKRLTGTTNALNQSKTFEYNKKGYPTRIVDAKGQVITLEYDVKDRLAVKHLPEGDVTYAYDGANNLLSVTGPDSQVSMTYGILNQVAQTRQTLNGQTYTISYTYDAAGNRTQMTSPWGATSYTYDALNRLTSIINPDNKTITFGYDAAGKRTRMTYPNGTETTYAYDAAGQLTQILTRKTADSTAITFSNYVYDLAGNRTQMQDLTGTHTYGYDDLHRLTSAAHPNMANETFAYDPVGNRLNDAMMLNYQYNAANRLLENSSYTYTYDANGNQTGQTHKTTSAHTEYAYTSENQLKQATLPDSTLAAYKYDPLGRRIEKNLNGTITRYVYDNEDIIATLDGSNTLKQNITHGPGIDEPLILKNTSTQANYYYHADGLGSITALSDNNGTIVETVEYQAYGKPIFKDAQGAIIPQSALGNFYAFTAREYDPETGNYYYRARYYAVEMGRFLQEDSMEHSDGVNYYVYVENNPLIFTDAFGEELDVDSFVQWLNENAVQPFGKGICATHVRKGLISGGMKFKGVPPGAAKDYGRFLRDNGFNLVVPHRYIPQTGDIVVIQPGNKYGHIQVWNGNAWVSDFVQPRFNPWRIGITPGPYKIYRYQSMPCEDNCH